MMSDTKAIDTTTATAVKTAAQTAATVTVRPKKRSVVFVIMRRELSAYFASPIAYIVGGLFLIFPAIFFVNVFFLNNRAELRNFFALLPFIFPLFVPALTMRMLAEEKRVGSLETLLTLPVTAVDVVLGKYIAACISGAVLLVPTLFYVVTCCIFGSPDFGPIIGGYLGALFLIAAYSAIGLFATSVTRNQIIAFFVALSLCFAVTFIGTTFFLLFLPASLVGFLSYFSAYDHFVQISRGIIDSRDLLYFVSVAALFLVLTVQSLKRDRS